MRKILFVFGPLLLLFGGCATVEEKAALAPMEPMAQPAPMRAGTVMNLIANGKPGTEKVVAVDRGLYQFEDNTGCVWKDDGLFMPAVAWDNCDGDSGTAEVKSVGNIWPLQVGSKVSYTVAGNSTKGGAWNTVRNCTVTDAVSITTVSGPTDVYKVICTDSWQTHTFYVSPAAGRPVLMIRHHNTRGTTNTYELVSISQ